MACAALKAIDISSAFVAFVCFYYYFDPMDTFVPFFVSASVHELAHLVVLFAFRVRVYRIKLCMSGAQIVTAPLSYLQELMVALAGPAANGVILMIFHESNPLMAFLNFCLLVYNLLPLYPLDGGRIINSLLHILLPQRIAQMLVQLIGVLSLSLIIGASCYLTCYWHAGLWPILVSALLLIRLSEMFLKEKRKFAHL